MQYWSWILMAVGVFGLRVAGKHNRLGWAVGFGAQGLWIAFAITTKQYGFIVSALAYGWVYAANFLSWRPKAPNAPEAGDVKEEVAACEKCKK